MKRKDRIWNMKTTQADVDRLNLAGNLLDRPASQIVREAIKKELDELAERFPELRAERAEEARSVAATA